MKRIAMLTSTVALLAGFALVATPAAYAQDQAAHTEHHPTEQAAPQAVTPQSPPVQQSPGGMMGMMSRAMMQQMMSGQSGMTTYGMMQPMPGITIIINAHGMPGMTGEGTGQPMGSAMMDQKGMADRQAMMTMLQAMNMPLTGDPDVDFARMMIPHHQGAVEMASAQLEKGKDPQLRAMAQGVIAAQEKEIAMLQAWLASHPK